jgi:hypothetical protein
MRLSSIISLAVLALPILLHSPGALSAEPSKDVSSCGATPREAIAIAEKALAEKGSDGQARAIACLLAAVKELDAGRLDVTDGKDKTRTLDVPHFSMPRTP